MTIAEPSVSDLLTVPERSPPAAICRCTCLLVPSLIMNSHQAAPGSRSLRDTSVGTWSDTGVTAASHQVAIPVFKYLAMAHRVRYRMRANGPFIKARKEGMCL